MNADKVQTLIKKMISETRKIKSVVRALDDFGNTTEEYYFTFPEEKYQWSVVQSSDGSYSIFYYPNKERKSEFLRVTSEELDFQAQIDLKELFDILRGKLFGFDEVLDDILASE